MDKLERAFYYNSIGELGEIDIQIFVKMSKRELNDNDRNVFRRLGTQIADHLEMETINTDPKRIEAREKFKKEVQNAFECAGLAPIYMEPIKNEYSEKYSFIEPWYSVTTRLGRFKVGWRKRVIHLEWENTVILQTADELLDEGHVTTAGRMIHCWGMGKLHEYLQVLAKAGKGT